MAELGYIEHNLDEHTYGLGPRVFQLGSVMAERLNFETIAWPFLASLREELQETIVLGVMSGQEVVCLGLLESPRRPGVSTRLGHRDPVHATSLGKAILAFHSPNECTLKVAALDPLQPKTPKTIVDPGALAFELRRTRERGYALEDEENEIGARCVGVPVLGAGGQPVAGLALAGPVDRIDLTRAAAIAERLWLASREMSRRMEAVPVALAS
jgi:DNA-binding IclR family transcriptional regulator